MQVDASNTFSDVAILIARLAHWIRGECVRTFKRVIYEIDYKADNFVFLLPRP